MVSPQREVIKDCNTCAHHSQGKSLDDAPVRCWDCLGGSGSTKLRMWEPLETTKAAAVLPMMLVRQAPDFTEALPRVPVPKLPSPPPAQPVGKHPLHYAFDLAVLQVTSGKGLERHGQGAASFWDQPWKSLADTHGVGFLTGQAAKKLQEAQGMTDDKHWEREMLGVLTYAAMAILHRTHQPA